MKHELDRKSFLFIMGFAILIFLAQTRGFHLLFDGLTYSRLARNIITSGDWKTLHYGVEQYPVFYQHPPLAIWMQACIYRVLGWSESISRILPSMLGIGTTALVYLFSRARYGLSSAVFSGMVLLTSTRFIKWGSNFYLDGILSFFCFAGFSLLAFTLSTSEWRTRSKLLGTFVSGFFLGAAFMVKGVASFPVLALCGIMPFLFWSGQAVFLWVTLAIGMAIPILGWIEFAEGWVFLQNYFALSVKGRAQAHEFSVHPWQNIYKLWWPWWPVMVWAFFQTSKKALRDFRGSLTGLLIVLAALSIPFAYSFGVVYMEHYLTPFYPFASVVVGAQLGEWFRDVKEVWLNKAIGVLFFSALFLATVAPDVNQQRALPSDLWLSEIRSLPKERQGQLKQIAFSDASAELWLNLAVLLGRSDWQAIGAFSLDRKAIPGTILITKKSEKPQDSSWKPVPCLNLPEFTFFSSSSENYCE